MICGIDEAGRGPVCGPLTIGCVVVKDDKKLKKIGVRDSKNLSPNRRRELDKGIREIADKCYIRTLPPDYIDNCRDVASLNEIEAEEIAKIVNRLKPKKLFVDSPDRPGSVFADRIRRYLRIPLEIHSTNFAESKFPVVAAASIIAKVKRDADIEKLHGEFGYFGSGYPSDEETIGFLQNWIRKNRDYPHFVRKSWYTSERLMEEKVQRKVNEWF